MNWRKNPWPRRKPAPAELKAPWDFSSRPADPAELVPNLPTEAGRAMGAALAKHADAAELQQRVTFPDMLPRCSDCAFRAGTLPNGCEETLLDAIKCVVEGKPFYCHKGVTDESEPRRLCSGAMVLYQGEHGDRIRRGAAEARAQAEAQAEAAALQAAVRVATRWVRR